MNPAAVDVDPADERARGWLTAIAAGSEAALSEFYRAFQARIYAFALRRLEDPAAAADVVNDVMLQVWRTAGRFEGRSRPATWVLGIAHHKVIDKLRERGRHRGEALEEDYPDEEPAACDLLALAEQSGLVRRCLETLSAVQRQVVQLTFFEELSYPEIAQVMACPEGTVKTRMFHAKAALRRCLANLAVGIEP